MTTPLTADQTIDKIIRIILDAKTKEDAEAYDGIVSLLLPRVLDLHRAEDPHCSDPCCLPDEADSTMDAKPHCVCGCDLRDDGTCPEGCAQAIEAESADVARVRAVLAEIIKCSPGCPGWGIFDSDERGTEIERCDACCHGTELTDDDVALLPEAQAALAAQS
jgi:hypothetical protein